MSRNSSGTYVLPALNPVVSGTTIAKDWANNTLSDISTEITNSLDRNGRGGMLAALRVIDGTIGSPAHGFSSETASGLYRAGTNDLRMSINSIDTSRWLTTGPLSVLTHTFTGTAARAPINLIPQAAPSTPSDGDVWVETTANKLKARVNGSTLTYPSSPLARSDLPSVGQQVSSSSGLFTSTSGTFTDVTNLTVTFTSTGRPVMLLMQPDGLLPPTTATVITISTSAQSAKLAFVRDGTELNEWKTNGLSNPGWFAPQMMMLDTGASAGSHTWKVQTLTTGGAQVSITNYVLVAYEL